MRIPLNLGAWCLVCFLAATCAAVGQTPDSSARFPVYLKQQYGFINRQGELVIQPRFDLVRSFSEGLAAVLDDSQWNYIDESGKVVIAVRSRKVRGFSEGLAAVMFSGRYGYIDKKGNVLIKPQFEVAFDFSEGLARVKFNGEWAFIDKRGRIVFVAPFDYADDFRDGYAMVAKNFGNNTGFAAGELKVSYIGKSGNLMSIGWHNAASRFSEAMAYVSKDANIIAAFARGGGLVMDNSDISDPVHAFSKPVRYSFINANGQTIFEGTYEYVRAFADHRAVVCIKGKCGYVNELGEMIIPPQFDSAETFSEGLAYVALNEERYFIDTSGRIVFRTDGGLVTPFTNGLAQLLSCNDSTCRWFYVDKQGRVVWQAEHDKAN